MIIRRIPWARQPQSAIRTRPDGLGRGLLVAINPAVREPPTAAGAPVFNAAQPKYVATGDTDTTSPIGGGGAQGKC